MKKIISVFSVCAIIVALPVQAVELSEDQQKFFSSEDTTLKVVRYCKDGDKTKARLKGTQVITDDEGIETKTNRIVILNINGDFEKYSWTNDDLTLKGQEFRVGNLDVGKDDFLRIPGKFGSLVDYTKFADTQEYNEALAVGQTITVFSQKNWKRPDGTLYSKLGDALFRLRLEETRTDLGGHFKVCLKQWDKIQHRGIKTKKRIRYQIQNYTQVKIKQTLIKLEIGSDETIGAATALEYILLKGAGTYESWMNEAGRFSVPSGYKTSYSVIKIKEDSKKDEDSKED